MDLNMSGLAAVFDRYPVVAAYLFGSQASGQATALSDVDVAVLLEPNAPAPGMIQARLISDLMLVFHRSDVDVLVLNRASVLLRDRAIVRGRLLYCRDDAARVRFEVATRREYLDTQPLRERLDVALLERYAQRS